MTKKTVTKKQILKAIKSEPLRGGSWVRSFGRDYADCEVCAVGAVLRNTFRKKTVKRLVEDLIIGAVICNQIFSIDDYWPGATRQLKREKNYMGLLSVKFEYLWANHVTGHCDDNGDWVYVGVDTVRKKLSKFVQEHFPNKVTFEY